jgi:hypothetical protein
MLQMKMAFVKENKIPTSAVWNMVQTEENLARYFAQFESDSPPMTEAEALERAGATFFPHCMYFEGQNKALLFKGHQCEIARHMGRPTMATDIAFGNRERTEGNIHLARRELDENRLGLEEGQIAEERKTLQWLKNELRKENERERQRGAVEVGWPRL